MAATPTPTPKMPGPLTKGSLAFERKNQSMTRLPKYAKVTPRPIPHPPPSNPYSRAPKTVYISTKTPYMSAVKRVQKLLRQSERRALDALQISNPKISERERVKRMEEGGERVRREENGVVVKGTGRAIEKALAVGRWFVANGREEEYGVAVKTGSVLVVDDVGIDEGVRERVIQEGKKVGLEGGEGEGEKEGEKEGGGGMSKSAAKKRKRAAAAEEEELPDSRTRWVNLVEITVSLK